AAPRRRRPRAVLAAAALLLGAGAVALVVFRAAHTNGQSATGGPQPGGQGAAGATGPSRLRLLVPAYFYPEGKGLEQWDRLIESPAAAATVAIVNPDSG